MLKILMCLMCIVLLISIIIVSKLLFQELKDVDIPAPGLKKPLFVSGLVFLSGLVGVMFFIGSIIFPEHSHDWLIAIGLIGGIALLLVVILVTVASVKYKSDYVCLIMDCLGVFGCIWTVLVALFFLYTLFDPSSLL